jgi:predicted nucleic acid-binding protein
VSEYLLDTDIISAHLRGEPAVTARLAAAQGRLHASVISLAELFAWIDRRNTPRVLRDGLVALIPDLEWEPITFEIARRCGQLRAHTYDAGRPLPLLDLLVSSTALEYGFVVVTHNIRHYHSVPGLTVEDWMNP